MTFVLSRNDVIFLQVCWCNNDKVKFILVYGSYRLELRIITGVEIGQMLTACL